MRGDLVWVILHLRSAETVFHKGGLQKGVLLYILLSTPFDKCSTHFTEHTSKNTCKYVCTRFKYPGHYTSGGDAEFYVTSFFYTKTCPQICKWSPMIHKHKIVRLGTSWSIAITIKTAWMIEMTIKKRRNVNLASRLTL